MSCVGKNTTNAALASTRAKMWFLDGSTTGVRCYEPIARGPLCYRQLHRRLKEMRTHKLVLSIVAISVLVYSLSLGTVRAADPATPIPAFVAQTLKAAGIRVKREGNFLTVQSQVVLEVPSTLQDWEDMGLGASLVEPFEGDLLSASEDDLVRFAEFRNCISAANFISELRYIQCEFNLTDVGDLICKSRVLLQEVSDDLQCIFTYLCTPENDFCA